MERLTNAFPQGLGMPLGSDFIPHLSDIGWLQELFDAALVQELAATLHRRLRRTAETSRSVEEQRVPCRVSSIYFLAASKNNGYHDVDLCLCSKVQQGLHRRG